MKKTIISVICILTAAVLILGGYGIYFLIDTDGDMEKVCIESSSKKSTEFDYISDSKDPHRYYALSLNGDDKYQELFIFDEQPFLFIKHTGRYHLAHQSRSVRFWFLPATAPSAADSCSFPTTVRG